MLQQLHALGGTIAVAVAVVVLVAIDASIIVRGLRIPTEDTAGRRPIFWPVAWGLFWGIAAMALPVVAFSVVGMRWTNAWMYQLEVIVLLPLMIIAQGIVLALVVSGGLWVRTFLGKAIGRESRNVSRAA